MAGRGRGKLVLNREVEEVGIDAADVVVGANQHVRRGVDRKLVDQRVHQPNLAASRHTAGAVENEGVRVRDGAG